jgi:hypothetical protein
LRRAHFGMLRRGAAGRNPPGVHAAWPYYGTYLFDSWVVRRRPAWAVPTPSTERFGADRSSITNVG